MSLHLQGRTPGGGGSLIFKMRNKNLKVTSSACTSQINSHFRRGHHMYILKSACLNSKVYSIKIPNSLSTQLHVRRNRNDILACLDYESGTISCSVKSSITPRGEGGGGIGQVLHHPKFVFFFRLTTPLSNTFSNTIFWRICWQNRKSCLQPWEAFGFLKDNYTQ